MIYHLDGSVKHWSELQELGVSGFLAQAFRRELFQTLVQIAITSIWILPVIAGRAGIRVAYLIASAGLHLWLSSRFYLDWAWNTPVIDGGGWDSDVDDPDAGRLTRLRRRRRGAPIPEDARQARMLVGGAHAAGIPPLVRRRLPGASAVCDRRRLETSPLWTMSQRTGSVSYLTFAAGFSLAVYASVFRAMRSPRLADRSVPNLRPERAGRVRDPPDGRRAPSSPTCRTTARSGTWLLGFSLYFAICVAFNAYLETTQAVRPALSARLSYAKLVALRRHLLEIRLDVGFDAA